MEPVNENDLHASEIIYKLPDGVPDRYLTGGAFIFAAYGCALLERQTPGGMYVYTAANCTTGKSEILSHRKKKLDESGFADMAAKISAFPIRGDSLLNIDKKPDESATTGSLTETANLILT